MNLVDLFLPRAISFSLVMSRLSGYIVTSPFPGSHVTATQRVGLICVLSWIVASFAPLGTHNQLTPQLVSAVFTELACGVAIGMTFRVVMSAADSFGSMLSQSTGLSMAMVMNPSTESQDTTMGRVATMLAMLLALTTGVHRLVLSYLLESFRILPVGSHMDVTGVAPLLVQLTGNSVAIGVRLAMPLVAIHLVAQVALGIISRAAPSLQIFSIGLSVMVLSGILTAVAIFPEVSFALVQEFLRIGTHLDELFQALGGKT